MFLKNAIFNNQKKCRLCNNIYLKKIFSFSKIPISEKYVSKSKKIEKREKGEIKGGTGGTRNGIEIKKISSVNIFQIYFYKYFLFSF